MKKLLLIIITAFIYSCSTPETETTKNNIAEKFIQIKKTNLDTGQVTDWRDTGDKTIVTYIESDCGKITPYYSQYNGIYYIEFRYQIRCR